MKIRIAMLQWHPKQKCWCQVVEDRLGKLVYAIDLEGSAGRPQKDGELWVIDVDELPAFERPGLVIIKARLVEPVVLDYVQFDKDDRGRVRAIYDFPVGNITASVMLLLAKDQHYLVKGPGKGFSVRAEKLVVADWSDPKAPRFKFIVAILKDQATKTKSVKVAPVKAAKPKKATKKVKRPASKKPSKTIEVNGGGLGEALANLIPTSKAEEESSQDAIAAAVAEHGSVLV